MWRVPDSLQDPLVSAAVERLFSAAEEQEAARRDGPRRPHQEARNAQERADLAADVYMPVSREGGRLLYSLVRATRPQVVVEFGASFGISGLHLGAAVRDNGSGHFYTTELSAAKAAAARENFTAAGLSDVVTLLHGDARETLAAVDGPVGFVLLDGWKDLYLPVLRLLEPRLAPGALVIADDATFPAVKPYLDYVRAPGSGYESTAFPVEDGMEISCRT
jgi:predicted O-methyltransferase YrrM